MKGLYRCLCILLPILTSLTTFGQSDGDYQTISTGSWTDPAIWQRYNGALAQWDPAVVAPTYTDGLIRLAHNVTIPSGTVTADQITINSGVRLIISGVLNLNNGSGAEITTLTAKGSAGNIDVFGTLVVNDNVTMSLAAATIIAVKSGGFYQHNYQTAVGTIYPAMWEEGSTLKFTGYTSYSGDGPAGLNQTFYNVVWDCPNHVGFLNLNLSGSSTTIANDLTIVNTGSAVLSLSDNNSFTLPIGGNFVVQSAAQFYFNYNTSFTSTVTVSGDLNWGSTVNSAVSDGGNTVLTVNGDLNLANGSTLRLNGGDFGTGTVNVFLKGDLTIGSGATLTKLASGAATTIFFEAVTPPAAVSFTNSGSITNAVNFTIKNGAIVDLGSSAITGSGQFTLEAGATMKVGSPDGLAKGNSAGNVRVSGTRTYTGGGNIVYNGSVPQSLGDEWSSTGKLNNVAVNLEIANSSPSGVTNNLVGSTSLVGNLTLTSNSFNIGNAGTLIIQSNFAATGGTIAGLSSSNLTFSGSGTITGSLNFATGAQSLNNLTISRAAAVTLGTPLTISGILSFTEAGQVQFNGQTLTINGDITQSGAGASGGLQSNASSNLIIGGTGTLSALPFVNASQLNNLTLGRTSSGTYTLSSSLVVNGTLSLNAGTLNHTSGLTMANGSTFAMNGGTSLTTTAPNATGSYNVSYSGTFTTGTGLELPSSATALNNLTVAGNIALNKSITINGDVNINSGTLSAGTFNVTMAGDNFVANGGGFTMASNKTITFANAGSTNLSGSSISGIQFGNVTINSGATLVAPTGDMNIAGTWVNNGLFSANNGTVVFNGAAQNVNANSQPFYNVTFAGSGAKVLTGSLDVSNELTISSTLDAGGNQPIKVAGSWINNGFFVAEAGTVTFNGASQSIDANGQTFYNLILGSSGTKTLTSDIDINGSLTIMNGVTFDVGSSNYLISLAGSWTNDGTFNRELGTVIFDGTTAIGGNTQSNFHNVTITGSLIASPDITNVHGNWQVSGGTFNANGGTIQFVGNTQNITPGGQPFNNVVIGGTNLKTLQGDIDINGNLSLSTSAATFSLSTNRTVNLAGNFDASGGGILSAGSGLFIFDGDAQTITPGGETFFNMAFSGTGTKTLAGSLDVNGYVDINSALAAGSNTINVAGNWDATGGTFATTGTTAFDGTTQTILSNGNAFGTVTISGGTKTLQDALDVNGNLTLASTLDVTTGNFPVSVAGNWNGSSGTFTARGGEVRLDGAAQNITSGGSAFNSLRIEGTGVKTLQDALDVNGTITLANATSGLNVGSDQSVHVAGNWVNNSGNNVALTAANGKVTFDGGATSDVMGAGNTRFHSIDVTGSTNVEIESAQSITGVLTLVGSSSKFNAVGSGNAGVFTLISTDDDPTVDARIASLQTPSNFTGAVTVQRYMSKESMQGSSDTRMYRYISSPVSNAAVSQIQPEIPITGSFSGASTCSGCTSTSPSMYTYDETAGTTFDEGWVEFPDLANTETLAMGKGYGVFVRGNIITSALWDVRGPIFSGSINLPVTYDQQGVAGADGFNLVGNPYPSAIDWDLMYPGATNIANAIYILDNPNGRYAEYVGGVGTLGGSKDIAMGQAFWVEAIAANPQLPLNENMKSSASPSFFRVAPPSDLLRIELANSTISDETVIRFYDPASDEFDPAYDAWKLQNSIFNLSSILDDDKRVSINTLGSMKCGREIRLSVADVATGHYDLKLSGFESFADNVSIKLVDNYSGETIDARTTSMYGFNVDTNVPSTFGQDRFKVIFEFNSEILQPEILATDVCLGSDAAIQIANTFPEVNYAIYSGGNLVADIGPGGSSDLAVTISKDKLVTGDNVFELRAVNSFCDQINLNQEFTIVNENLPELASVQGSSVCQEGSVELTAAGADEGDFRWYETSDATAPIGGATGSIFTTPDISKTKTYYVAAVNSLGCEGPRREVVAEVISFDPVAISESEGQLVSSYAEGNQWYKDGELIPGATGQRYIPEESGTYSVEIPVGKCTTSAARTFLVTANEEGLSNGKVNIYPNPVKGELVVETRSEQLEPPSIIDPTGKVIGTVEMHPSDSGWIGTYDFSEKTKGLYILKVTEKGLPRYKRIIKE